MADEDKLINVIVKYSQENADQIGQTYESSKKQLDSFAKNFEEFSAKHAGFANEGWSPIPTDFAPKAREQLDMFGKDVAAFNEQTLGVNREQVDSYSELTESIKKEHEALLSNYSTQIDWAKESRDFRNSQNKPKEEVVSPETFNPKPVENYNERLRETTKEFRSLRMAARELGQVGAVFSMVGGLLTAGIVADANNYVKTVGRINQESAQWLATQEGIKKSNLEIGKVAAEAMLPAMKTAAEFMKDIADTLKQNPWMIEAALYVGGAMTAIGVAISVVSQVTRVISVIGLLTARLEKAQVQQAALMAEQAAMQPMNNAGGFGNAEYMPGGAGSLAASQAGAMGMLGTVTLMATSVIIGAEIGSLIGNAIAKMIYGEDYKKQNIGDALMTYVKMLQIPMLALMQIIGKMSPGLQDFANTVIGIVNKLNTSIGGAIGASEYKDTSRSTEDEALITEQETQAYIGFQKQMTDATTNYGQQRADTVEQYEQQILDSTAQYESQRMEAIDGFERQMARQADAFRRSQEKALENYNLQADKIRAQSEETGASNLEKFRQSEIKSEEEFHRSSQRAAQAHAVEMQRLEQQHNIRLDDLAAQRDALGIAKENQSYTIEQSQREQDFQTRQNEDRQNFQIQQQERRQEFAQQEAERKADAERQLEELRINYERQKEEAISENSIRVAQQEEDQKLRLDKMEAAHKAELANMDEQEKKKLDKLDEAYAKQVDQIQTAFIDRLRSLDSAILGDTVAFTAHLQQQAIEFQSWLANFRASQTPNTVATANTNTVRTGTGKQNGGYAVFSGAGETGREEFVSSGDTTKQLEGMIGSRLTQSGLLSAVMAGRNNASSGGSRNIQITVQSRNLTLSEIKSQVDNVLNKRLGELLPAFGV
jgi:hypothetical protein